MKPGTAAAPGLNHGRFKTPHGTNPFVVVLVVVVLVATIEVLVPRVVRIVLRRTPVVVGNKASNSIKAEMSR